MRIFVFVILWLVFVSSALGIGINQLFKLKLGKFGAPVGFALLLFTAQLLYYPVQILNLSSTWIHVLTAILLLVSSVYAITQIKGIVLEYLNWNILWFVAYLVLFFVAFYNSSLSMPRADTQMYLNYIAQNENTNSLNLFNLWTGLEGSEFVSIYLFQGYFHFIAAISFFIKQANHVFTGLYYPESLVISAWGFGALYAMMSGLFIITVLDRFKTQTRYINWVIALYALFFVNFYYWKVAFAFYGNTWRSLFMAMMMFYLYEYISSKKFAYILVSSVIFGASIAASSSSLFIGFAILLGFAFYLLIQKQEDAILLSSYVGLPMVLYVLFLMYNDHPSIFLPLLLISLVYYSHLFIKQVKHGIQIITTFISQRAVLIFLVLIPIFAIIFSIYDVIIDPQYPWNMFHYFNDHRAYDMVIDYLFIHSTPLENVLNLLRWAALILLVSKKHQDQNEFFKWHIVLMFVFLLNPLTTSFVSKAFASNVYYRAFESLFNVFTEIFFLVVVFKYLEGKKAVQYVLAAVLVFITVNAHYQSLILQNPRALYGFYIREGQKVDPLYKLIPRELDIILAYREEIKDKTPKTSQFTIVSHADGLRTFEPRTHVLFTARQYWSAWDRVDQDFYQIGRIWYGWEVQPDDLPFDRTCTFLKRFNVDYVINEIWVNYRFDQALEECTTIVYGNQDYRLRRVND
jgi:hypothetical protein